VTVWAKIALRNVAKNRRRSFYTILAIGLGYAAVNVFGGFTSYIITSLGDSYIYAQAQGHLTIFKKGFRAHGAVDPAGYLLEPVERSAVETILAADERVLVATPQLNLSGLLSNGDISTIFVASGRVFPDMKRMIDLAPGMLSEMDVFEGESLEEGETYAVAVSRGLAAQLGLELGSDAVAVAPTLTGQMNALDVEVGQLFESAFEFLNERMMLVPLDFAQALYDTESVDRLTVLLSRTEDAEEVSASLREAFAEAGLDVEAVSWIELSPLYTKVRDMFDVIFLFIFVIVFIVAAMSVVNTIGMAVLERTREIGTLRALGVKRRGIVSLFMIESALLGTMGSVLGLALTLGARLAVAILHPTWVPPITPHRIPLVFDLVASYALFGAVLMIALSVAAAAPPARRASRRGIVDALGHV
jgi:putative ABC transport system permease protein